MKKDLSFHDYVLNDLLAYIAGIRSRPMFGGWGLYKNGIIFAIIVEELGFVGGMATIALFASLFGTMCAIAKHTTDPFGKLLVLGIGVWVTGQAFLNMGAISGLAPLTGIPLPFISYGGTALMAILASMGIALNVARRSS